MFLKQVMSGVQAHIQSPLPDVRHVGMVVAECLMSKLTRPPAKEGGTKSEEKEGEEEKPGEYSALSLVFDTVPVNLSIMYDILLIVNATKSQCFRSYSF